MSVWEFLTGGPAIKSSSTTDAGIASRTVHVKVEKVEPETGGMPKHIHVQEEFSPATEPAPAPPMEEKDMSQELPDEVYDDMADAKTVAASIDERALGEKHAGGAPLSKDACNLGGTLKKLYAKQPANGFFKNGKPKKPLTSRQTYEKHYGEIMTKGMVVHHLDGDETNFHISNLNVIKRADLLKLNTKG